MPDPTGPPTDEDVLAAVAAGRPHAFDVLVARYGARVQTFLRYLLGEPEPAEDLTQDVFVKVYQRALEGRAPERLDVWLFAVARNEARDHLRRRGLHRRVLDAAARGAGSLRVGRAAAPSPDADLALGELTVALEAALAELPEEQRAAFLLREREGLTYEELGAALDCTPKTASTRLARARAHLRERLRGHRATSETKTGATR